MRACLAISARPALNPRAALAQATSMSLITTTGWWMVPTRLRPRPRLIAFLPPTAESAWAASVVGTRASRMPRLNVAATNPAMSPMASPPTAITRSSRCMA